MEKQILFVKKWMLLKDRVSIFPGDLNTIYVMELIPEVCEDWPYFFSISTPAILQPGMSKSQTHVCISLPWWFNWWYHEATVTTLHPPLYALVSSTPKPRLCKRTPPPSSYAHQGSDKTSELGGNSAGTQANLWSPSFSGSRHQWVQVR